MIGASFYFLCAVFPARSPLDRRLPWLKWVAVVLGLGLVGEMSIRMLGRSSALIRDSSAPQRRHACHIRHRARISCVRAGFPGRQLFFAREPESRRKIRVIFWGTVVGFGPSLIRAAAQRYTSFPFAGLAGDDPQCHPAVGPGFVRLCRFQAARARHPRSSAAQRALRAGAAWLPVVAVFR